MKRTPASSPTPAPNARRRPTAEGRQANSTQPFRRLIGALSAAGLSFALLVACAPVPEPAPLRTALFSSDEDAYSAAEEVYEAYNAAGNAQRAGDTASDPQLFLTGTALAGDIDGKRQLEAAGLRLEGNVRVASFIPLSEQSSDDRSRITADVCLDISGTAVFLDNGAEADLPNRPQVIAQRVEMTWDTESYLISAEFDGEDDRCGG